MIATGGPPLLREFRLSFCALLCGRLIWRTHASLPCARGGSPTSHLSSPPPEYKSHPPSRLVSASMSNLTMASSGPECGELPEFGLAIGVVMGVFGSVGINIGQNIQAAGLQELPVLDRLKPCKSRGWIIGLMIFISFSLLNFSALALAPASILTPLESIQFVANVIYNKFINHSVVSRRMVSGVALAILGTALSIGFGAASDGCHTLDELTAFWTNNPLWWGYMSLSMVIATTSYFTYRTYVRRLKQSIDDPSVPMLPHHRLVMPIAFTFASASAGGAQMIVHSKVTAELLALIFSQGDVSVFTHWLLYVEVVLVSTCGIVWGIKLTECLGLFDPLLILPLMVGTYILFGGIAGGIFFQEFNRLHIVHEATMTYRVFGAGAGAATWVLYCLGVVFVLGGLCLIAVASAEVERDLEISVSGTEAIVKAVTPASNVDNAATPASNASTPLSASSEELKTPSPGGLGSTSPGSQDTPTPAHLQHVSVHDIRFRGQDDEMRDAPTPLRRARATPGARALTPAGMMPTPGAMRARAYRLSTSGNHQSRPPTTPLPPGTPLSANLTARVERNRRAQLFLDPSPDYDPTRPRSRRLSASLGGGGRMSGGGSMGGSPESSILSTPSTVGRGTTVV